MFAGLLSPYLVVMARDASVHWLRRFSWPHHPLSNFIKPCHALSQLPADEFLEQHDAGQLGRAPFDLLRKLWADPSIQAR